MHIDRRHILGLTALVAGLASTAGGCGSSSKTGTASSASTSTGSPTSSSTATSTSSGMGGAASTSSSSTGGTSTSSSTGTGGTSTSTSSSSTGGASSSSTGGSGTGGSNPNACTGANDSACQLNGTTNGLCLGGTCSACMEPADDQNCGSAYGMAEICLGGVCTPGDCRMDSDCMPAGEICGVTTPNTCGKCTTDAQCQNAMGYGTGYICNTTKGVCVKDTGCTNDMPCAANPKDICCNGACVPGNCCAGGAQCSGMTTCKNNHCTACMLVTNDTYYVDPMNGDDGAGTGTNAAGCTFKTITRALQFIGTPTKATTIEVLPTATVGAGETFPIVVPAQITIQGGTAGTFTVVQLAAGSDGFHVTGGNAGLDNLQILGSQMTTTNTSGIGVFATGGSKTSSTLTNLDIKNTGDLGIYVTGNITIGTNVTVTGAGNAGTGTTRCGMLVGGGGLATITVNTGDKVDHFDKNTGCGIEVRGTAAVVMNGTLATGVIANANNGDGLSLAQTPTTPQLNDIANFVAENSVNGNGITVYAGSSLKLRSSATQGNKGQGIKVNHLVIDTGVACSATSPCKTGEVCNPAGAAMHCEYVSDDLSQINLGIAGDPGGNTLQYQAGSGQNGGVGLCLDIAAMAGQTLNAQGNKFEAINCVTGGSPTHTADKCQAGQDYGILVNLPATTTTNKIDITKCM